RHAARAISEPDESARIQAVLQQRGLAGEEIRHRKRLGVQETPLDQAFAGVGGGDGASAPFGGAPTISGVVACHQTSFIDRRTSCTSWCNSTLSISRTRSAVALAWAADPKVRIFNVSVSSRSA